MASDLEQRLKRLLAGLPEGSYPTVSALSDAFGITEADVDKAMQALGLQAGSSPTPSVEQTVHGTANAQIGNHNVQYNISPLHTAGIEVPTVEELRELMTAPDSLSDLLEHHLVRQRSRRVLSRVLSVATEHLEWELVFQEWVKHTPELHGQAWFVKATVTRCAQHLSKEDASRRRDLFHLLFAGLLDTGQEKEALDLLKTFLTQLETVDLWVTDHWNVIYGVVKTFWKVNELGDVRQYPSEARRNETQFWVTTHLKHTADHLRRAKNANNTNQFLTALAYLLQDIDTDEMISLIDHCTRDEWLAEVLELQTARELLNALDQARQPSQWWDEEVSQDERLLRHSLSDMVAKQILRHVETQIGRTDYFYELVSRAGMKETPNGEWVSRFVLEVGHRSD